MTDLSANDHHNESVDSCQTQSQNDNNLHCSPDVNVKPEHFSISNPEADATDIASELEEMRAQTSSKKRKSYTILEKLKIAELARTHGQSNASIARMFKIPESTIRVWIRDEARLRDMTLATANGKLRMKMRYSNYKTLDEKLYTWYWQQSRYGDTISGPVLREKARRMATAMYGENFNLRLSNGWLQRFKVRHGLKSDKSPNSLSLQKYNIGDDLPNYKISNATDNTECNIEKSKTSNITSSNLSKGKSKKKKFKTAIAATSEDISNNITDLNGSNSDITGAIANRTISANSCYSQIQSGTNTSSNVVNRTTDESSSVSSSSEELSDNNSMFNNSMVTTPCTKDAQPKSTVPSANPLWNMDLITSPTNNVNMLPHTSGNYLASHETDEHRTKCQKDKSCPTIKDAVNGLETALKWFQNHHKTVSSSIVQLNNLLTTTKSFLHHSDVNVGLSIDKSNQKLTSFSEYLLTRNMDSEPKLTKNLKK